MYGSATNDNLLENEWLPGVGTFILNLLVGAAHETPCGV